MKASQHTGSQGSSIKYFFFLSKKYFWELSFPGLGMLKKIGKGQEFYYSFVRMTRSFPTDNPKVNEFSSFKKEK